MKLFSFIIPAFNAELTIKRTIDSIIRSSIVASCKDKIEILVILNGCTDNTLDIMEDVKNEYDNVKCLFSKKGVSAARNEGLRAATGEWVVFVDADDTITETALKTFRNDTVDSRIDLFSYGHYVAERPKYVSSYSKDIYLDSNIEAAIVRMLEDPTRYMQVWAKLFSKKIIDANNLFFNESLTVAEDSDFTLRYLLHSRGIKFCTEVIYNYLSNDTSTMRAYSGVKVNGYLHSMEETEKEIIGLSKNIREAFNIYILTHFYIAMVREVFSLNNHLKFFQKYKEMDNIIKNGIFYSAINNIKVSKCRSIRMWPALLLKYKCKPIAAVLFQLRTLENSYFKR